MNASIPHAEQPKSGISWAASLATERTYEARSRKSKSQQHSPPRSISNSSGRHRTLPYQQPTHTITISKLSYVFFSVHFPPSRYQKVMSKSASRFHIQATVKLHKPPSPKRHAILHEQKTHTPNTFRNIVASTRSHANRPISHLRTLPLEVRAASSKQALPDKSFGQQELDVLLCPIACRQALEEHHDLLEVHFDQLIRPLNQKGSADVEVEIGETAFFGLKCLLCQRCSME